MGMLLPPGTFQGITDAMAAGEKGRLDDATIAAHQAEAQYRKFLLDQAMQQNMRDQLTRQSLGPVLNNMYPGAGGPPPVGMPPQGNNPSAMQAPAPPPGQASVPMGPPAGMEMSPQGGPMVAPPPVAQPALDTSGDTQGDLTSGPQMAPSQGPMGPPQPPVIPPYRTMEDLVPKPGPASMGAPPPVADKQPGLQIPSLIKALRESGVPQSQWMDHLEKLKPVMDESNRELLSQMKIEVQVAKAGQVAAELARKTLEGQQKDERGRAAIGVKEGELERKTEQGNERIANTKKYQEALIERWRSQSKNGKGAAGGGASAMGAAGGGASATGAAAGDTEMTDKDLSDAARFVAGQHPRDIVGTGRNTAEAIKKLTANGIKLLMQDEGLTAQQAGTEIASRNMEFKANQGALTQVTKDVAAIGPFTRMLDKNANVLTGLADKLVRTDNRYANRTLNWLQTNMADNPDVADFMGQVRIVQTEAARVLNNPRLVGQLTDSARHEMDAVLSGDMSVGSLKRMITRVQADAKNRTTEMQVEKANLAAPRAPGGRGAPPPVAAAVPSQTVGETKIIGGVTYHKVNGQWMQ